MAAGNKIIGLADSTLFFRKPEKLIISLAIDRKEIKESKAVYIGAFNGDNPAYYHIFLSAMNNLGITHCNQIFSCFNEQDKLFLKEANVILMSGGDPAAGLHILRSTGMHHIIGEKYAAGSTLIGVSAGTIVLGWEFITTENFTNEINIVSGLKLIPFSIGAHEEKENWKNLKTLLKHSKNMAKGIGIPFGSGFVFHPDGALNILNPPLHEFMNEIENIKTL